MENIHTWRRLIIVVVHHMCKAGTKELICQCMQLYHVLYLHLTTFHVIPGQTGESTASWGSH